MSSTPPDPTVPPGYKPGDYVPFADRDPNNPQPIAGQAGPVDQTAQAVGQPVQPRRRLTPEEHYRAIYGYDATPRTQLAGWGRRVLAYLFDLFLSVVAGAPLSLGYYQVVASTETTTGANGEQTLTTGDLPATAVPLLLVGGLLYLAFYVYNVCIRQGRTGYTFGKAIVGIKLVGERSGQPIGGGMSFVRQLAHIVDGLVCNLGYLWPLWDSKKQTFADKIMGTLVIVQPQDQPRDPAGYQAQS
jgi:uncharacterized RDD family membrane protein YckC